MRTRSVLAATGAVGVAGAALALSISPAQAVSGHENYQNLVAQWEQTFIDPRLTPLGMGGNCGESWSRVQALQGYAARNRGAANFIHNHYSVPTSDPVLGYSYALARRETTQSRVIVAGMQQSRCPQVPRGSGRRVSATAAPATPSSCASRLRRARWGASRAGYLQAELRRYQNTYHVPGRSKTVINYQLHIYTLADRAAADRQGCG